MYGYKVVERVVFDEIGGVMLNTDIEEYVVITPEMVIGVSLIQKNTGKINSC